MSVAEFLNSDSKTAFSFEVLPPMRGKSIESIYGTMERLLPFHPKYVNITTHRNEQVFKQVGSDVFRSFSQVKRPGSVAVAAALKFRYGIDTVPHIICGGFTKREIEDQLFDLSYLGITDLLVLRGDKDRNEPLFTGPADGHCHANELEEQINAFNGGELVDGTAVNPPNTPFTYGVAGYPEKHEEAMNMAFDIENLRRKVALGAGYVVTQMFFDNRKFFRFERLCRKAGITVPIIPGLKPLGSLRQMQLLPKTFHIDLPEELTRELQKCKTNDDVKTVGTEWGTRQALELKEHGVKSIHFYTVNATDSVEKIAQAVYKD